MWYVVLGRLIYVILLHEQREIKERVNFSCYRCPTVVRKSLAMTLANRRHSLTRSTTHSPPTPPPRYSLKGIDARTFATSFFR